ncbi:hypothetical protein BTM25_00400 [Actinomadura rubteroloni]|uniref:DUF3618 domain-containing protein n=1 Tax=Actinomadura rubteroloni TaxID=1926885 RepID=A0A2P4UKT8_9ACTN|nr:DUF3618 domain-containing protein [Actinomadura rubteroloni]POM25658.1 hypothetical protein BTM25_00400 [Actinomadura rubteroloni]
MAKQQDEKPTTDADGPAGLRAQIDRKRADLGDTVEALAAKADVKARAKDTADEVRDKADEVKEKAGTAVRRAQEHARATTRQVVAATREDPGTRRRVLIPASAALLAAGALAGRALRRRRARRNATPWQRASGQFRDLSTTLAGSDAAEQAKDIATRAAGRSQEVAARAADRGRDVATRTAASPATRPRVQGALAAAATLLIASRVRKRR